MANENQVTKVRFVIDPFASCTCVRYLRSFNELEVILTKKEKDDELIDITRELNAFAEKEGLTLHFAHPITKEGLTS